MDELGAIAEARDGRRFLREEREAQEQAAIALAALKRDNLHLRKLRGEAAERVPESERSYYKPTDLGGLDGPEK